MNLDALTCIFTRRSIRKFTGEALTDEQLHTILRAGFSAPTAANLRPWQFVVVRDPETLKAITEIHPYSRMLPNAGCGILVCGDTARNKVPYFLSQDGCAAIENMLLAAHALGLGAVWIGAIDSDAARAGFDIPEHVAVNSAVLLGYPAEEKQPRTQYTEEAIYWQKYDPQREHPNRTTDLRFL